MPASPIQLAVLISGGGRTLINLYERIVAGSLDAAIRVVVSSKGDAPGVRRSRDLGLTTVALERKNLTPEAFDRRLAEAVAGADLVCMAGFLSLWHIPEAWAGRVINIHPALLPEFGGPGMYGRRVHEAVLAGRKTESGCTVHFCDHAYDHGPIILQRKVPVLSDDTAESLAARVFAEECVAYPEAIQLFAEQRVSLSGGVVAIT